MKNILFYACFLLGSAWLSGGYAQPDSFMENARNYGMGGVSSVLSGAANPSFTSFESFRRVELNYTDRFNLKELSYKSAHIQYPAPWFTGSLFVGSYGIQEYHETRLSLALSHLLTEKWGLGIRINYDRFHYSETHQNRNVLSADVGVIFEPWETDLKIGLVLCNPLYSKVELEDSHLKAELPVVFTIGAAYSLTGAPLLFVGEIQKVESHSIQYKWGMEYQPFSIFCLRGGFRVSPFVPGFGMGIKKFSMELNAGFSFLSDLGLLSSLGVCYQF